MVHLLQAAADVLVYLLLLADTDVTIRSNSNETAYQSWPLHFHIALTSSQLLGGTALSLACLTCAAPTLASTSSESARGTKIDEIDEIQ